MEDQKHPLIVSADRLEDSVIIYFDDGRSGIFSSELLAAILPQAAEIPEPKARTEQTLEKPKQA